MKALLLFLPLLAFGAKDGAPDYDILARTFNFVLFVLILFYLLLLSKTDMAERKLNILCIIYHHKT